MTARQRRAQGVNEIAADPRPRALDDGRVVVAGLAPPLPCQCERARVVALRQAQRTPAQERSQLRLVRPWRCGLPAPAGRSEGHTSALQSLMRTSYAVSCLKK